MYDVHVLRFSVEAMEIFMDDISVYGSSFEHCLKNLETVLQRCQDKNLALNWENVISC